MSSPRISEMVTLRAFAMTTRVETGGALSEFFYFGEVALTEAALMGQGVQGKTSTEAYFADVRTYLRFFEYHTSGSRRWSQDLKRVA